MSYFYGRFNKFGNLLVWSQREQNSPGGPGIINSYTIRKFWKSIFGVIIPVVDHCEGICGHEYGIVRELEHLDELLVYLQKKQREYVRGGIGSKA